MTERQAELYGAKGYSEEWQARGVKENQEYAILTATIAKGTFGLTPGEHKEIKGLKNDHCFYASNA